MHHVWLTRAVPPAAQKTFSIAIFCACLALAFGLEVVVFSPARRASRKLLERIVEFIRLAGGEKRIVEYNQEACRLNSFDGKKSLIRSFPSKVGVRATASSNRRRWGLGGRAREREREEKQRMETTATTHFNGTVINGTRSLRATAAVVGVAGRSQYARRPRTTLTRNRLVQSTPPR